jgi:hypothetical protein
MVEKIKPQRQWRRDSGVYAGVEQPSPMTRPLQRRDRAIVGGG